MIAAAALLVACSSNDNFKEVVEEEEAIGFNASFVNKNTRAEITTTYLREVEATTANQVYHDFGVFGYKASQSNYVLFDDEQVTVSKTGTGTDQDPYLYDWSHSTVRFWDKNSAARYTFYAYAPYGAYNVDGSASGLTFSNIPVITKIQANHIDDVVVATPYIAQSMTACTDHTGITDHVATHSTYVPFVFRHIFSRLSFKVKTHEDYSHTAVFTIKNIDINFPSDVSSNTPQVSWSGNGTANANTITYSNNYTSTTTTPTSSTTYETAVFNGSQAAAYEAAIIGDAFIVTPVNATVTKHAFNIKVTYDVQYMKEDTSNPGQYIPDGDPETGCIAIGRIDTKIVNDETVPAYNPGENDSWVITIDINPEKIDFCVDEVNNWNPEEAAEVEVE